MGAEHHAPALFCGDTLFNAGVGNCHNGGNAQTLYQTFLNQLYLLPNETRIYPGHDYIANNLKFSLNREPDNAAATCLLSAIEQWSGQSHYISTIEIEKKINAFFRLTNPQIIQLLRAEFDDLEEAPSEEEVFLRLRALRDRW